MIKSNYIQAEHTTQNELLFKGLLIYGLILALFPPKPQANQKERSHGRLGIFKVLARSSELITICHKNEEVYPSDSDTP